MEKESFSEIAFTERDPSSREKEASGNRILTAEEDLGEIEAMAEGGEDYFPSRLDFDFGEMSASLDALEKADPLKGIGEAVDCIEEIYEAGKLGDVYDNVTGRILAETDYFKDFEEVGIAADIVSGLRKGRIRKVGGVGLTSVKGKSDADFYLPLLNRIFIHHDQDDIIFSGPALILALATDAFLPEEFLTLKHEHVHAMQYPEKNPFRRAWKAYKKSPEEVMVDEVGAYRLGWSDSGSDYIGKLDFVTGIERDLRVIKESQEDMRPQLIYVVNALDSLKALGFNNAEIARFFSGKLVWDSESQTYPEVQHVIDKGIESKGIDDLDLENLVHAKRIERDINRLKSRNIAREELAKAVIRARIKTI